MITFGACTDINADDFGRNESVTKAILECLRRGWVASTTMMVGMPYADEAAAMAKDAGFAGSVGLHLDFTEGKPLTHEMAESRFCTAGALNLMRDLRSKVRPFDRATAAALRAETRAQVEKYLGYGFTLGHCDGHHHVHTWLPVAYEVLPILAEYGFKTVRRPYNVGLGMSPRDILRRVKNIAFSVLASRVKLGTSGWFTGLAEFAESPRALRGSLELMAHPDFDSSGTIVDVTDFERGIGKPMEESAGAVGSVK